MGDVPTCANWWSVVDHMKRQFAAQYGKINQGMTAWKFLDADAKVFLKFVGGKPTAFVYAGGKAQVCWELTAQVTPQYPWYKGVDFISPDGAIKSLPNFFANNDAFRWNYYGQGYWTDTKFTKAISFGTERIFYRGKEYNTPTSFYNSNPNKAIVSAMFYGGTLIVMYYQRTYTSGVLTALEYFITTATLTGNNPGTVTLSTEIEPLNLSTAEPGILYAGFGGDNLIWTVSRDESVIVNSAFTDIYVRAYGLSNGAQTGEPFQPTAVLLDSKTISGCVQRNKRSDTRVDDTATYDAMDKWAEDMPYPPGPGSLLIYTGEQQAVVRTYHTAQEEITSSNRDIKDIFIQDKRLSVAFQSSTRTQESVTDSTVTDLARFTTFGIGGIALWAIYLAETTIDVQYTNSITASSDIEVKVFDIIGGAIIETDVFSENLATENYNWTDSFSTDGYGLPAHELAPATPTTKKTVNLQYADGINAVYGIFYDTTVYSVPTSSRSRHVKVKGHYGALEDLGGLDTTFSTPSANWNPMLSLIIPPNTTTDISSASNTWLIECGQGSRGAFDGKTYLLGATHEYFSSYHTALALSQKKLDTQGSVNGEVLRLQQNKQSLTVASR